ncbi:hypothetical protein [Shimia sagamensis]|uniref:Acetoacetate decarboxylase (ADC) n=1 Tax=Shimia sagamensis TaxID=1566352 RepID=A0ABY1PJW4_9RHOB|nr:hypothetical protein [Shimia sagamensis]SMP34345.1 hypothetical protein SAMN06265373_11012 [Shimia sagamensis]
MTTKSGVTQKIPYPENSSFWYGSFSAVWVYHAVPIALLNHILAAESPSLKAFEFSDLSNDGEPMGLVNINFMTYSSDSGVNDPQAYADILKPIHFNDPPPASLGIEPTHECELNIVSYSNARENMVPQGLTSSEFILGRDHTKTLGNYRLWVPCDDRIAVYWGMHNFGENKVMTHPFVYTNPALNNPGATSWDFTIPAPIEQSDAKSLFGLKVADLDHMSGVVPGDQSEIIDLSLIPHKATNPSSQRLVASRRNIFGQFKCLVLSADVPIPDFTIEIGSADHPMVAALMTMFGGSGTYTPVGLMTYRSPPVISESSLYYVDL